MKPERFTCCHEYVFDEGLHQKRIRREQERRRETAKAICERLREWYALPYEAVEAVAEVLEKTNG